MVLQDLEETNLPVGPAHELIEDVARIWPALYHPLESMPQLDLKSELLEPALRSTAWSSDTPAHPMQPG